MPFLVFLSGMCFIFPSLQSLSLLFIPALIYKKRIGLPLRCPIDFYKIWLCLVMLIPIIICTNYLSAFLLSEFSLQKSVTKLQDSQNSFQMTQIIAILLLSPIVEEIYFRGLLLENMISFCGIFWAIFISSFYFAFIHLNILSSPTLFALGLLLGLIYIVTRSVFFPILLHILFNTVMLCAILFN